MNRSQTLDQPRYAQTSRLRPAEHPKQFTRRLLVKVLLIALRQRGRIAFTTLAIRFGTRLVIISWGRFWLSTSASMVNRFDLPRIPRFLGS